MRDEVEERLKLLATMREHGRIEESDYQAAVYRTRDAVRLGKPLPALPEIRSTSGGALPAPRPSRFSAMPRRQQRKLFAWAAVAVVVIVLVIVGAVSNGSGSHHNDNGKSDAASFIKKINQNAKTTAADGTGLLTELEAIGASGDLSGLYQIAADAKSLHDHMKDWRSGLLGQVKIGDDDQMNFVDAENEVKNAAGSIQSWAGDPNPAKTADLTSQLASAVSDWNASVRIIWAKAGRHGPPTIGLAH